MLDKRVHPSNDGQLGFLRNRRGWVWVDSPRTVRTHHAEVNGHGKWKANGKIGRVVYDSSKQP